MQPSELLRCELGEVSSPHFELGEVTTTRTGVQQLSTGQSKGLPGEGANKKKGSEMGGTRCQEENPGRGR